MKNALLLFLGVILLSACTKNDNDNNNLNEVSFNISQNLSAKSLKAATNFFNNYEQLEYKVYNENNQQIKEDVVAIVNQESFSLLIPSDSYYIVFSAGSPSQNFNYKDDIIAGITRELSGTYNNAPNDWESQYFNEQRFIYYGTVLIKNDITSYDISLNILNCLVKLNVLNTNSSFNLTRISGLFPYNQYLNIETGLLLDNKTLNEEYDSFYKKPYIEHTIGTSRIFNMENTYWSFFVNNDEFYLKKLTLSFYDKDTDTIKDFEVNTNILLEQGRLTVINIDESKFSISSTNMNGNVVIKEVDKENIEYSIPE